MSWAGELGRRTVIGQDLRIVSRLSGCGARCYMHFIDAGNEEAGGL